MKPIDKIDAQEKVILVGIITKDQTQAQITEYLDELEFLAQTAGGICIRRFTQKLQSVSASTFIGKGKLEEIHFYIQSTGADMVIFDDELSPIQLRNIEKKLECKILDRNNLILDIFAKRAQTAHAKVQVELAQYQYLLPRLTRMWTHLSRQKGGIGQRGPGETEIETDRRIIRDKISRLKKQLESIDKQKVTQRKNRLSMIRVSLVGYTNVGKSTLMNILSRSDVFAENKLFATLDTTVRKVVINEMPFLLSDTVGFIRKLPHQLVESFKSTLDEVREADLLLHVIDVSHPNHQDHYTVVNQTLMEIGANDKPCILIFNKIDLYPEREMGEFDLTGEGKSPFHISEIEKSWKQKPDVISVFISAEKKIGLDNLKDLMHSEIKKLYAIRYPYSNY